MPQEKTKKAKGEIQTGKKNLDQISNQVDAAEEEHLLEEEAALQEEGEETDG